MHGESTSRVEPRPGDVIELSADELPQLERDLAALVHPNITGEQLQAVSSLPPLLPQIDPSFAFGQPPRFRATLLHDPLEQLQQTHAAHTKFSRGNHNTPPNIISEDSADQQTFVGVLIEATEPRTARVKGVSAPVTYFPAALVWYGIEPGAERQERPAMGGAPSTNSTSPAGSKVGRGVPVRRYVAPLRHAKELRAVSPTARHLGYKMLQLAELTSPDD